MNDWERKGFDRDDEWIREIEMRETWQENTGREKRIRVIKKREDEKR